MGDQHLLERAARRACPRERPAVRPRPCAGRRPDRSAARPRSDRRSRRRTTDRSAATRRRRRPHRPRATPISPTRPRQPAPPIVAISSAIRAVPAAAPSRSLASSIAWRASSHSDAASADDEPSTPSPTCTPAARSVDHRGDARRQDHVARRAVRDADRRRRRAAGSRRGSGITQCATQVRSVHHPVRSRYSIGRHPNVARLNSSSSAFSAKWVCRRTSSRSASSAVRTISSSVTLNGEHGASAMRVIAPNDAVVVAVHGLLARGEDLVVVGDDVVGRQPAVLLGQRHRAAGRVEADAEVAGSLDLGGQQVAGAVRVEVEVIGRGRAARQRQLGEADPRRHVDRLGVERPPQRVQRLQPAEQRLVGHRRVRPREVLVQVVMGVDEPGRDEAVGGVEDRRRRAAAVRSPMPLTRPSVIATQPPASSRRSASTVATQRALADDADRRSTWRGRGRCQILDERGEDVAMSSPVVRGLTMQQPQHRSRPATSSARRTTVPSAGARRRSTPGTARASSRPGGTARSTARAPSAARGAGAVVDQPGGGPRGRRASSRPRRGRRRCRAWRG